MEHLDSARLQQALASLPGWKRVAFMVLCCERMLPNFRNFRLETGRGNSKLLSDALAAIWNWIETEAMPDDLDELILDCDWQAPDLVEHNSIYAPPAADAAEAIAVTLEALIDATLERAVAVASLAWDTIESFVHQQHKLLREDPQPCGATVGGRLLHDEWENQRLSLSRLRDPALERSRVVAEMRPQTSLFREGSLRAWQ